MFENVLSTNKSPDFRAYLVGVRRHGDTPREAEDHLHELEFLVDTMQVPVLGREMAVVNHPTPQFLVGSGKAEQIKANAEMAGAKLIIIDDELTPAQQRNWEKLTEMAVIDRREVIIDIFKQRAQTREARLQVELARLQYSLPRLKRAWTHLERQRGGGGFVGGAGEAQIEIDRRIVRDDIAKVKRELETVRQQRATQRKGRSRKPVPVATIVGYTNAGKSSLLNCMTGATVLAEDKLFATLDPTTRRLTLPNNQELLLTDTVGFIRKLPHQLVEAFKATLEETIIADLLIHVIDASHPNALQHLEASNAVLEELGALGNETIYVLNKIDLVEDLTALAQLRTIATPNILTSTITRQGIDELTAHLMDFTGRAMGRTYLRVPASRYDLISMIHREGHVLTEKYDGADVLLEVRLAEKFHSRVEEFVIDCMPADLEEEVPTAGEDEADDAGSESQLAADPRED